MSLRTRNSAAYKGLYALQMKRGGRDFRTGNTIDIHAYVGDAIDIHHIFPQHWCLANGIEQGLADSVVNKTAIDAQTNRRIGGRAPSAYLGSIEAVDRLDSAALDELLRSHDIDPVAMRRDDFAAFFSHRFERLLVQIEAAMGKPVNRSPDRAEHPFAGAETGLDATRTLISGGESKTVEFKSTGRLNLHTEEHDRRMEWAVLKSIAGFMNASGGTLFIGVSDDGSVVGVERDYPTLSRRSWDGWGLWLSDLLTTALGKAAAAEVEVHDYSLDGGTVARLDVGPAATPVFARTMDGQRRPVFLVRIAGSTHELAGQEQLDYQRRRWGG